MKEKRNIDDAELASPKEIKAIIDANREECRQNAHWIKGVFADITCSNCGFPLVLPDSLIPKFAYCPNCGARMKGTKPRNYAKTVVNWIPCSERLPEKTGNYLCTFGRTNLTGFGGYITEACAKKWYHEPEKYMGWTPKNVVAWTPLPEPYKE